MSKPRTPVELIRAKMIRLGWRDRMYGAPDLIARLKAAQNALHTPIDIVTFGFMAESKQQLERHVRYYEEAIRAGR